MITLQTKTQTFEREWYEFFKEGKLYIYEPIGGIAELPMDGPRSRFAPRMFIEFKINEFGNKLVFLVENKIHRDPILVYLHPYELWKRLL